MDSTRFESLRTLTLFLSDLAAGALALVAAYNIRFYLIPVTKGWDPADYQVLFPVALVLWMVARFWIGLHRSRQPIFSIRIFRRIIKCNILVVLLIMAATFYMRESMNYSRAMTLIVFACGVATMTMQRAMLAALFDWLRTRHGWGVDRVALLGISQIGSMTASRLHARDYLGRKPVGFISAGEPPSNAEEFTNGLPVLGNLSELGKIIRENDISEVYVTDPAMEPREVVDLLLEFEKQCIRACVVPNVLEMMVAESHTDSVAGIPLLSLRESKLRGGNVALKWTFDVLVSLTMLVLLALPMLFIAVLVKLSSRGPLFYRQERVGMDGKTFNIYKFRSMRTDAESASGPVMAKPGDDRVTPLGKYMRAWNLDELPQLFNVLSGQMSLVGPRPERPHFVDQFKEDIPFYMARHKIKAGITGWAQVNGLRGDTSISERLEYDLYYIKNWSIWFDIKILLMTLKARENAY